VTKNINARIAAEISWARTSDRSARTRPAREAFLKRFEREVDPEGKLPKNAAAVPSTPSAPTCSVSANAPLPRGSDLVRLS
jgi:hypothetical protein